MTTDSIFQPLIWQESLWANLVGSIRVGRLSHACLLHGQRGIGKEHLARCLAGYLLCESPTEFACGQCSPCQLFAANLKGEAPHPDFLILRPEKSFYSVDEIRGLSDWFSLTRHSNARRVVIIEKAEQMAASGANALLRILEEPPQGCHFILCTQKPMKILPTIRSRVAKIRCQPQLTMQGLYQWIKDNIEEQDLQEEQIAMACRLCQYAPLRVLDFLQEQKLDQFSEFCQRIENLIREPAQLVVQLKEAGKQENIEQFLDWLAFMVLARLLDQDGLGILAKQILKTDQRMRLHGVYQKIMENKSLLANNMYFPNMLIEPVLEYSKSFTESSPA